MVCQVWYARYGVLVAYLGPFHVSTLQGTQGKNPETPLSCNQLTFDAPKSVILFIDFIGGKIINLKFFLFRYLILPLDFET